MQKLTIFERRIISLFLNARDKIKHMSLISKQWNAFIYTGLAWQNLFDKESDKTWNIDKIDFRILEKFKNFKSIQSIYLTKTLILQPKKLQLLKETNLNICFCIAKDNKLTQQDLLNFYQYEFVSFKIQGNLLQISAMHADAYWNKIDKIKSYFIQQRGKQAQVIKQLNKSVDYNGRTALHYASTNGALQSVIVLLNNGADPNVTDYNLMRPIDYASMNGHLSTVKELIQRGSAIKNQNVILSAITYAKWKGNAQIVDFLLKQQKKVKTLKYNNFS